MIRIKCVTSVIVIIALSGLISCKKSGDSSMSSNTEIGLSNLKTEDEFNLKQYSNIVVLSGGAVETIYMLGGEDSIAGIGSSREEIWPKDKTTLLPSVGNLAKPSLEAIIALEPDLVIMNGMVSGMIPDLESRGIPCYMLEANGINDILDSITILGIIVGRSKEATQLYNEKKAIVEQLKSDITISDMKIKGAVLYTASPLMAFTNDSLPGELLELLGVRNIASDLDMGRPILSSEYILAQNPDFLFCAMSITDPEKLLEANPFLKQTRAGREGNFGILSSSLILRPSPRLFDEIPNLIKTLKDIR